MLEVEGCRESAWVWEGLYGSSVGSQGSSVSIASCIGPWSGSLDAQQTGDYRSCQDCPSVFVTGMYCGSFYAFVFSESLAAKSVETNGAILDLGEWHGPPRSWTFDATVAVCRSVCWTRYPAFFRTSAPL
jgi:hypothetical protein